jgi:hypothetical protein
MDNFNLLITHVKAASKNMNGEYVGEILVPSGWYPHFIKEAYERALKLIEVAGKRLVLEARVPSNLSLRIGSLISRDKVMVKMNQHYGKYE